LLRGLLCLILLAALAAGALRGGWASPAHERATTELEIEPGTTPRGVARGGQGGVQTDARLLYAWFRLSGKDRKIKAGNYEIPRAPRRMSCCKAGARRGKPARHDLCRRLELPPDARRLAAEEFLKQDTAALSDADIMTALGKPGVAAEGRFFPDTYTYAKGSSGWPCSRAAHAMDRRLARPGPARGRPAAQVADEALILASIVEKETGPRPTGRRLPACSSTACAWACCCRPTPR
jgi:UPF0755 protein